MFKRILGACVVTLVFGFWADRSNAAPYLRPVVQVSALANNTHADAGPALGGGLAWGGVFGRSQRFDVGGELTTTRFSGDFSVPTAWVYDGPSEKEVAWKQVPAKCLATTASATFRYVFTTNNQKIRPFCSLTAGITNLRFSSAGRRTSDAGCWTVGLGGGVSYQFGRLTSVDFGYRYSFSNLAGGTSLGASSDYNFRYNAHVLSVALTQCFGRARK